MTSDVATPDGSKALAAPGCRCDQPVADLTAHCIRCGRRIRSIVCDRCGGTDLVEIEHVGNVAVIRCEACRYAGRRPTVARHRRIVTTPAARDGER
jgi:hypothetical protein